MSLSPLAFADSLRIGTVDFVSPDEIRVLLDIDAPGNTALNTGTPRPFPRINGYVLAPGEHGHLVAQVEWITIERSPYPKRRGMQDFGLLDLPYPLRKMSLNPLGLLSNTGRDKEGRQCYEFKRGIQAYPSVGDPVLLPTQEQLRAIVESGENRRVKIGVSPLAANAEVTVDPDRLFGRHLAVLGNTGSGKSCSVAGLIRWSLEEAKKTRKNAKTTTEKPLNPNARFIILDPNGEYTNTFKDIENIRLYAVSPSDNETSKLQVPLWLWNSAEWASFAQASPKTQRPALLQALRTVRDGGIAPAKSESHEMRRYLRTLVTIIQKEKTAGSPWGSFPKPKNFVEKLKKWEEGLTESPQHSQAENAALSDFRNEINKLLEARSIKHATPDFSEPEIRVLLNKAQNAHREFGGHHSDTLPIDADMPRPFSGEDLLRSIEANAEILGVSEHVETMLMRIRTILSDSRMKSVINTEEAPSLPQWLEGYIGGNQAENGSVTVIDLSLVPTDVIHILTSVIARMTLEALQRYRKLNNGRTLPTVLVMEEAHTFVRRYSEDTEDSNSASICCKVFEKIAREGRKFGLGLVLSSQRPSELSPTVLSQCNTYLLHRISNDRDQELIHRLVPDNLRGLLRDLPSLPARHAVLLGWATELPVLVQMNNLPKAHRPRSDDPDFWAVWSGIGSSSMESDISDERQIDWKKVASDWQQIADSPPPEKTWVNNETNGETTL